MADYDNETGNATTYINQHTGQLFEAETTPVGSGTQFAGLLPSLNPSGYLNPSLIGATTQGGSAAQAKRPIMLDGGGHVSSAVMPIATGKDTRSIVASELLVAGAFVNVWSPSPGQVAVRNADRSSVDPSTMRPAHGFVLSGVTQGNSALVYFEGTNDQLSGLPTGAPIYLEYGGLASATAPATGSGELLQKLGTAISPTEVSFEAELTIVLLGGGA